MKKKLSLNKRQKAQITQLCPASPMSTRCYNTFNGLTSDRSNLFSLNQSTGDVSLNKTKYSELETLDELSSSMGIQGEANAFM